MSPPEPRRPQTGEVQGQMSQRGERKETVHRLSDSRRERREHMFPDRPDVVEYLEGLDRRRDAARRLHRICQDAPHVHALGCHDPQEMTG